MAISPKTIKMLWGRAAARCSLPTCRRHLVLDETGADPVALVGDMCHIVAEAEDGPRGASPLTKEERDLYDNLILLCRNHHGEIDGQPGAWPVERLKAIKAEHEKWVRENLADFDPDRQRDEEVYASYVDEWARRSDLDNWTGWLSFVLGGGQPSMTVSRDSELEALRRWLLNRIWPGRYPKLEQAFANFRLVLQDFQNTFRHHAEKPTPDNDWLLTRKFYHIDEWDEERYERLGKLYDFHVDLVEDLALELTRAANLICDEVRALLLPHFRLEHGHLTAQWGPLPDLSWRERVMVYSAAEKAADPPYPGLEAFMTARETRDWHFGKGAGPIG